MRLTASQYNMVHTNFMCNMANYVNYTVAPKHVDILPSYSHVSFPQMQGIWMKNVWHQHKALTLYFNCV